MTLRLFVLAAFLAPVSFDARAEEPVPAAKRKPNCESEVYRQFDFWAGDWTVTANGKAAGENRIEKILDGCALLENWSGAGGHKGKSLNFYDNLRGVWHQTWIDFQGMALALDGKFADGRMTLTGTQADPLTRIVTTHRITWTPLPSGEVRQLWDTSVDGQNWTVQFDGLYTRKR